jgi:hypothetical protein
VDDVTAGLEQRNGIVVKTTLRLGFSIIQGFNACLVKYFQLTHLLLPELRRQVPVTSGHPRG